MEPSHTDLPQDDQWVMPDYAAELQAMRESTEAMYARLSPMAKLRVRWRTFWIGRRIRRRNRIRILPD